MNNNQEQIKSDILTILLCNRTNVSMPNKQRAIVIAKCCKRVRDKTKDNSLFDYCRSVIKTTSNGKYFNVLESIAKFEQGYFEGYGL